MKEVVEMDLLSPVLNLVTYKDGSKQEFEIKQIKTRDEALHLCKFFTKRRLQDDSAYDNLHKFRGEKDLPRLRNYEIEQYLHFVSNGDYFGIIELCPFNGFNYMGITGDDLIETRYELPNE